MKVLVATGWSGAWPYVPELLDELSGRGVRTDVFDTDERPRGVAAAVASRLPSVWSRAIGIHLTRKLRRLPDDYDGINIHFAAPIFRTLAPELKRRGKRLVTSIWGSEYLRASRSELDALRSTLDVSDVVTTNNPEIGRRLERSFPEVREKLRVVPFGLRSLDVIDRLRAAETIAESRARLGLPADKTIVTIGYNGGRQQQHELMIEGLARLPQELKARAVVLAPMTYPDDRTRQAEVESALSAAGLEFKILRGMMPVEDICRVRIVTDYAVNMQTTDSLSASIQEHMYAGSIMVLGDWLPYGVFREMGVAMSMVNGAEVLAAALEGHGLLQKPEGPPACAGAIYRHSSWSAAIDGWMDLYRA